MPDGALPLIDVKIYNDNFFQLSMKNIKGFTLIEILVTIIIMAILIFGTTALYMKSVQKSKIAQAQAEMREISQSIHLTSTNAGKTLSQITGIGCTDCECRNIEDLSLLDESHTCITNWNNLLSKIATASGLDVSNFRKDPWGSPYLIDENEGEFSKDYCRQDRFRSAGPDKRYGTSNDIIRTIPFYDASCN